MTEYDKLVHMALHALQCPESITPEARADLAGKIESALAADAGDAAQDPAGRTPKDYAIEHAEYLAQAGEGLLEAMSEVFEAEQAIEDFTGLEHDATVTAATAALEAALERQGDAMSSVASRVYEFRKRRDRALAAVLAAPQVAAATVPLPINDARHLLTWMDEKFGNPDGDDWFDTDAASIADSLEGAFARFKRANAALAAAPEVAPQDNMPMVDIAPPATSRDRWMFRQGWLAALDPRSHAAAPEVAATGIDVDSIILSVCETDPADPEDTANVVCVHLDELRLILECAAALEEK